MCYSHALLTLVTSSWISTALAAPQSRLRARQNGGNQGQQGGATSIQPQIWIPLVVIAVLFVLGTIVACCGRRVPRSRLLSWGNSAVQAAGVMTGTAGTPAREVTAEQLAGVGGENNQATTNAGTARARRARRTRRTPSQISTHSLPAYMKEPGEQEIVIVRGADELEDDIPITITMPPVDEHGSETPRGSFDLDSSVYHPLPHSATNVPLLDSHEHDPQQFLNPDRPLNTRASFDSGVSSTDGSSHHYLDDAPTYETVMLDDIALAAASPAAAPAGNAATPAPERSLTDQQPGTGSTRRRSVFASIFNPRNSRGATAPASASAPAPAPAPAPSPPAQAASPEPRSSTGHTREGSGPSVTSERNPRRSRIHQHRPSHSGSGSMFSLLSRTRSNQNLNGAEALTSPSMISLHSISSPLTHTLVKTEFMYPKGGPTPDQIRFIASRESFVRFGKPYGADAIAYAASTSRIDLGPPPGFEEVAGSSGAGPSSTDQDGRDTPSSGSHDEPTQPEGSSSSALEEVPPEPHVLEDVAEVESPVALEVPSIQVERTSSPLRNDSAVATLPAADAADQTSSLPVILSSLETPPAPEVSEVSALAASPQAARPASPASAVLQSNAPVTSSSPDAPITSSSSNVPPSAFKGVSAASPSGGSFPARAASRASSYMSYATAEESLHSPTPHASQLDLNGRDDDAYESAAETPTNLTAPPTPRMSPRHVHEDTDTTIHD